MQFLKEELRQKILESAMDEFYDKGYGKASMRTIAKHSGITVGNIYRYFDGKEALFEAVVKGAMEEFYTIVAEADELIKTKGIELFLEFKKALIKSLIDCVLEHRVAVLILFRGAEGTKYSNFRDDFTGIIDRKLKLHFETNFVGNITKDHLSFISSVISSSCMEGFVKAIIKYEEPKELKNVMEMIYDYHFLSFEERFVQLSKK